MDIIERLEQNAREDPNKLVYRYLIDGESRIEELTNGQLLIKVQILAGALHEKVQPGGMAFLLFIPGMSFFITYLACLYAGITPIPTYPPLPRRLESELHRLEMICRDAKPEILLLDKMTSRVLTASFIKETVVNSVKRLFFLKTEDLTLSKLPRLVTEDIDANSPLERPLTNPEGIAFIQYSSGSTNLPKGVIVTRDNLMNNLTVELHHLGLTSDSRVFSWLPHYHDMGLIGIMLCTIAGQFQTTFMSPMAFIEKPIRWLQAMSKYKMTHTGAPNFGYELCLRDLKRRGPQNFNFDLSTMEVALCGAEPISPNAALGWYNDLKIYGLKEGVFFPAYGLAEHTLIASCGPKGRPPIVKTFNSEKLQALQIEDADEGTSLVSCGHVVQRHELAIVDPETKIKQPEEKGGEIWLKGPSVARGYLHKTELTETSFHAHTQDGDGPFLRTGDMGFIHQGELFIFGRIKDLIIVHGKKYAPQDIEIAVQDCHEAIRKGNVAAFSIAGPSSELLVIVAEKSDNYPAQQNAEILKSILQATTRNFQLPLREIVLIKPKTISKTTSGKIQRHGVRNLYLANKLEVVDRWHSPRH